MSKRRPALTKLLREAGPYSVESLPDGRIQIIPAWTLDPDGPGLYSRLQLADDIQRLLNQSHPRDRVEPAG